jgi:hypothetical protein
MFHFGKRRSVFLFIRRAVQAVSAGADGAAAFMILKTLKILNPLKSRVCRVVCVKQTMYNILLCEKQELTI